MFHIYGQYFHPETLLERVRDVAFHRRPRMIFKGFRVPDWAQNHTRDGWDLDCHSRAAWADAMHDMQSEWTPMQFNGDRMDTNILNWFRFEQWGKGNSARLFYNEVPKPRWDRHGGYINNPDKELYSFKYANQDEQFTFDLDTTTEEGRKEFEDEYKQLCEMAPEIFKMDELIFPHEVPKQLSSEPHFLRIW